MTIAPGSTHLSVLALPLWLARVVPDPSALWAGLRSVKKLQMFLCMRRLILRCRGRPFTPLQSWPYGLEATGSVPASPHYLEPHARARRMEEWNGSAATAVSQEFAIRSIRQRGAARALSTTPFHPVLKTEDAEILGDVVPQAEVKLTAEVVRSIAAVGREEWNACARASGELNPFLLWEFFHAVEESQSAVKEQGWLPQHVVVRSEEGRKLLGCCPLYLKGHSYGEYVFDHSWANAASRMGVSYYPKLQSCVPFTPVTGARLLVSPGPQAAVVRKALAETLLSVTDTLQVSSLHLTFNTEEEWTLMRKLGFLPRMGIQYHWENNSYRSFDDYLMALRQSKRKNIRQERKSIAAQGLRVDRLRGDELKPHHWDAFYKFYINTTDRKWGSAYLTREFFHMLGDALGDQVMLMVARDTSAGQLTAGALNLVGSHAIFGRNWGCLRGRKYKNLHFELCYYQALEAAIELGLERVEAGAQGEHKIQRGYLANFTYSSHYIRNTQLSNMVARYLYQERSEIEYTLESINAMASPYKS